jgi:small-conductance mechanosensitive channel
LRVDINNAWRQVQAITNDIVTMLPNLVLGALILLISFFLGKYAARLVRSLSHRAGQSSNVGLLLGRLAVYIVSIFGFLVALSTVFPSFKARDLIQVLGIGGVAVGFAFKDIFQNFLAGLIILISRPFRIGDVIAVKGYEGTVEDIQTRATMIRTYDNQRIVIPNSTVFAEEVKVVTAFDSRRTEIEFSVDYGADLAAVKEGILEVLRSTEGVDETPAPDVLTMNFGDSGLVLRVRYWVTPNKANILAVRDDVLTKIKGMLDAKGITFPKQTVVLQKQPSETEAGHASGSDWASGTNPRTGS